MGDRVEIVSVDASNVEKEGFFCRKSKRKSPGYKRKSEWLEHRFAEGMRIKILHENGRSVGFIEYVPGQNAWRAVNATDYVVIHCIWVVGRAKEKGYGTRLLNECIEDARNSGAHGVAMVTSRRPWLAGSELLLRNGFDLVGQAPPCFGLVVKRFNDAPWPSFPEDWDQRLASYGSGMTVVHADQCPYNEYGVEVVEDAARQRGLDFRSVKLTSSQEVQERAPSAYGIFNVVYGRELVTYHYEGPKTLAKLLDKRSG
jgi:L-amino acid N-acyltransferase YncA